MKFFQNKSALCFLGLLILLCHSCDTTEKTKIDTDSKPIVTETKPPETKPPEIKPVAVEKKPPVPTQPQVQANIVAKIGDYIITREELEKKLMMDLHPVYGAFGRGTEPINAKSTLDKMIAEKAMMMEARKLNYLEDETIQASLKRYTEEKLVRLLLSSYLKGKITITAAEIDEQIKTNPKLSRAQAQSKVGKAKANTILNQYYKELYDKLHVQKLSRNFPQAAEIHQRLLLYPKEPRRMRFIRVSQVRNELTPEEKNIVLATYDNGTVTLKDWFDALCQLSPPSRPRDLNSAVGVERLLDRALRMPIFASEAKSIGLDKDENLLKQIKEREDLELLSKATREKVKAISEPNEQEIIDYFEKNKEAFGTQKTLKIDQIWCQDFKTAQTAKAELESGKNFESVRQKYSLQKKGNPYKIDPRSEGIFFKDLWKGDPNEVIGPVKGFYNESFKWRIVKILEKTPGEVKEYSSSMINQIKTKIQDEQRNTILENYRKELLEKYSYEIYAERIKDIDPLNIP